MLESRIITINEFGDNQGLLAVVESCLDIPFSVERIFYIYNTKKEVRRGCHAHFKTRQVLIAVSGSCKVFLDNIRRKKEVFLDTPTKALVLEPNDWHEMYCFSQNCVLLVLASRHYDEGDYIRDYKKFIEVYGT